MHHREHEATPVKVHTGITKSEKTFHRGDKSHVIASQARQSYVEDSNI
jgi:hypothetical protein